MSVSFGVVMNVKAAFVSFSSGLLSLIVLVERCVVPALRFAPRTSKRSSSCRSGGSNQKKKKKKRLPDVVVSK